MNTNNRRCGFRDLHGTITSNRNGTTYDRVRRGRRRTFSNLTYASTDRLYDCLWAMVEKGQIKLLEQLIDIGHFIRPT